jgi:hypothetical protein
MSNPDTGTAAPAASPTLSRRRSPLVAFLIGVGVVGVLAALAYLFWPNQAETPATPAEAAITDEALGLPAPDAASVRAQVDQALRTPPSDTAGRAESAAAAAQAQTAPERGDVRPQPSPQPGPQPSPRTAPGVAPEATTPLYTPNDRVRPATPEESAPVAPPEAR